MYYYINAFDQIWDFLCATILGKSRSTYRVLLYTTTRELKEERRKQGHKMHRECSSSFHSFHPHPGSKMLASNVILTYYYYSLA